MPLNLYSKASVDNLLADKLDLAGGTMTGGLTLSRSEEHTSELQSLAYLRMPSSA